MTGMLRIICGGNMWKCAVFIFIAIAACGAVKRLPSYITPCKANDPKLNECALEQGRKAIPNLAKGDKGLRLRPLDPLHIPEIKIDTSSNLKLILTDVKIIGLSNMELHDLNFDSENRMVSLDLRSDQLQVLGNYNINGRILILPIQGSGKINVTVDHGIIGYGFHYDLMDRKGKKYVKPNKPIVSLTSRRYYFDLENLFNGDPRLGPEMNRFLNENYQELARELNPSVTHTIGAIAADIVKNMMTLVPYDELLLP